MSSAPAITSQHILGAIACLKTGQADPGAGSVGQSLPADQQPVVTPVAPGLVAVYLMDMGPHFAHVQHHHLAALKAPPKGLHELGLINLGQIAEKRLEMVTHGAIKGLLLDGQFEASLMLLDGLWDGALAAHAPNGAVVAIPTPDVLAFCDFVSAQGLRELQALVRRTWPDATKRLTQTLYHRHGGRWMPLPDR
jgi:uncharacterized protein YtpQ (UPF0354 family)